MEFELIMVQSKAGRMPLELLPELIDQRTLPGLILFPELWVCGFNRTSLFRASQKYTHYLTLLQKFAAEKKIALAGTLPLKLQYKKKLLNRFIFISETGSLKAAYDKLHLFPLTREQDLFDHGKHPVFLSYSDVKIGLSTCYDLRFPELFRFYAQQGVSIVLLAACFPKPRLNDWKALICARAIENQIFFAAVNAVGSEVIDSQMVEYFGHSMIVSPAGQIISELDGHEQIGSTIIDFNDVFETKQRINYLNDIRPYYQ